jgi:hypothetical protein
VFKYPYEQQVGDFAYDLLSYSFDKAHRVFISLRGSMKCKWSAEISAELVCAERNYSQPTLSLILDRKFWL